MFRLQNAKECTQAQGGYAALFSVILVTVILLSAASVLLLLGTQGGVSSRSQQEEHAALSASTACAESALESIRENKSYSGSGSLTLARASCTFTVTNLGGTSRQVAASGVAGDATRKVTVLVTATSPTISVTSWQDTQ